MTAACDMRDDHAFQIHVAVDRLRFFIDQMGAIASEELEEKLSEFLSCEYACGKVLEDITKHAIELE